MLTIKSISILCAFSFLMFWEPAFSQENHTIESDEILITVILKHQQDKNLTELQKKMDSNRFWQSFPPEDIKIESWYVAMGLGQVITVKIHPKDLRRLNLAIEKSAWGVFTTDIYPTYAFKDIAQGIKEEKIKQDKKNN